MHSSHCLTPLRRALFVLSVILSLPVALWQPLHAQPPSVPGLATETYEVQFPNVELRLVVNEYERISGKTILMAPDIPEVPVTIETSKKMTRDEWLDYVDRALLLNGVALIPVGPEMLKVVSYDSRSVPNLGIPIYSQVEQLPLGEQIVSFVMELQFITTAEASRIFSSVVRPNERYASVTEVPNASVVVVTENTDIIRRIIELKEFVDKPSAAVKTKIYKLERADAEEVAAAISDILQQQEAQRTQTGAAPSRASAQGQRVPGVPASATAPQGSQASPSGPPDGQGVIIYPDIRTNRLFVIARPIDFYFLDEMVMEFDAPADVKNFLKRSLNHISVVDALPALEDVLSRQEAVTSRGGGLAGGSGGRSNRGTAGRTQLGGSQRGATGRGSTGRGNTGGFGSNQLGGGTGGRGGVGGGGGGGGSSGSIFGNEDLGPESIVIGKTFLVADSKSNNIIVSGPPESIRIVNELLDELDVRPRQVYLSTIIGQITLGNDIHLGMDLLREVEEFTIGGKTVKAGGLFKTGDGSNILDIENITLDQVRSLGTGLSVYGKIGDYLNAYLRALESTDRFKVLSRPSIYISNNRTGIISSGNEVAVPTSTQSSFGTVNQGLISNIEFKDVLLQLEVRPLINSDEEVTLEIRQINDNIIGTQDLQGTEVPIIATQELETEITVPNKSTIVLGGLITESRSDTRSGLPFFVRVPILKYFFGDTTKTLERQELLIFIQPHIIGGEEDLIQANLEQTEASEITRDALTFGRREGQNTFLGGDTARRSQPVARPATTTPSSEGSSWGLRPRKNPGVKIK